MKLRKLKIRSRHTADKVARLYVNDDAYLRMDPNRMHYIATQLIDLVSSHYILPLRKIQEVTQ